MANTVTGYLGVSTPKGREVLALGELQPFVIITATSDGYTWQGDPPPANEHAIPSPGELMLIANTANVGLVKVAINAPVGSANFVPMLGRDVFNFPGVRLNNLHLWFEKASDRIHLVYLQED